MFAEGSRPVTHVHLGMPGRCHSWMVKLVKRLCGSAKEVREGASPQDGRAGCLFCDDVNPAAGQGAAGGLAGRPLGEGPLLVAPCEDGYLGTGGHHLDDPGANDQGAGMGALGFDVI